MESKPPLLSICIPTYNRASVLEQVLNAYVNDKDFDDEIEIVISDNASTDNTRDVCQLFVDRYTNIHYYRNEENIKDANFPRLLDKANGDYLKLMNDNNKVIHDFGLGYLKQIIREGENTKSVIFFSNGNVFNCKKNEKIICNGIAEFYLYLSFYTTALHVFGAWREDWALVENKDHFSSMQLAQVDWAYQIVRNRGHALLYNSMYFNGLDVGKRSGYNYFNVLVDNYYKIILPYLDEFGVPEDVRKKERATYLEVQIKKRLIWQVTGSIIPTNQKFDFTGSWRILWKYYKRDVKFYCFLIRFPFSVFKYIIMHFLRTIKRMIG